MRAYKELIERVLAYGELRGNRTNERAVSTFGGYFEHDLQDGFPLLTTKEMKLTPVAAELVGFLRGITSAAGFRELGTKIWDKNANVTASWLANPHRKGVDDLGPIYGDQWRNWPTPYGYHIDQLQGLIDGIKKDPFGRRHLVTAWNPSVLNRVSLPACHVLFQCYVRKNRYLDLQMYQRSADLFLGVPFNIASYAMLNHVLAMLTGLEPGRVMIPFGDLHLYENHLPQAQTQLERDCLPLPELTIRHAKSIDEIEVSSFQLHGYVHHAPLTGAMAE